MGYTVFEDIEVTVDYEWDDRQSDALYIITQTEQGEPLSELDYDLLVRKCTRIDRVVLDQAIFRFNKIGYDVVIHYQAHMPPISWRAIRQW